MNVFLRSFFIFDTIIKNAKALKKIILLISGILIISCSQKENQHAAAKLAEEKKIDSINEYRQKRNDSIAIKNTKNHFRDLSGQHQFTHSSFSNKGNVTFKNIGRDLYQVSGNIKSGKDYAKIEGEIKMVSEEFLNFNGKITQSIQENDNGKIDVRTKKTSFHKKANQPFWRLQNRQNSSGFTDNIDIH